jgi:hypothetical protein
MTDIIPTLFGIVSGNLSSWVTVLLTGVIAVATIVYVLLTGKLWTETKRSADAATVAALAAKKSAEIAAALHRPFMGLSMVTHRSGWGTDSWEIVFVLKNYGTLPAVNVGATIDFFAGGTRFDHVVEPTSVQIFPSVEVESTIRPSVAAHRVPIQQGTEKLQIAVRIPYQTEDGRQFEYTAEVSYTRGQPKAPYMPGQFQIDKSETK